MLTMYDEASPPRRGDPPWRGRTAHRTSTPQAMAALRDGRRRHGWNLTKAAERTGVSRPFISQLESGTRRPSESVARDLITAYGLTGEDYDAVMQIARPLAGRDSPYRTGVAPPDLASFGTEDGFRVQSRATAPPGAQLRATAPSAATPRATQAPAATAADWIEWAARKAAEQA